MCPTDDLMKVSISAVTSPIHVSTNSRRPAAGDSTLNPESVATSLLESRLSRCEDGLSTVSPGMEWVEKEYLNRTCETENTVSEGAASAGDDDDHNGGSSTEEESAPMGFVYITEDDMTNVTPSILSSTVEANATRSSGIANVGVIACNFRRGNAKATSVLRDSAEQMYANRRTAGAFSDWAKLFVPCANESVGSEQQGAVGLASLVLPAHDSMVDHFQYDGNERMTWRALPDGCSVLCVFVPWTHRCFYTPKLSGRIGKWSDDLGSVEFFSFELSASRIAKGRFQVQDKYGELSGTADAPSGGVAILAVLLSALEGGCGTPTLVRDLNWKGGHHPDNLISIH